MGENTNINNTCAWQKPMVFGVHDLFQWQRDLGNGSGLSFQTYDDRIEREHFYIVENRDTVDMDFQYCFKSFWEQEFVWGQCFRYIGDETSAGIVMKMIQDDRSDLIYSAFIQDQLVLTFGANVEHNNYTGHEYQASARLQWIFSDKNSGWGAVSRAFRVPSRMKQDVVLKRALFSDSDLALNIVGSYEMDAEELINYEVGYRFLGKQISFGFSFYYNDYDNLRTIELIDLEPGITSLVVSNGLEDKAYGVEIATSWLVNHLWRINAVYFYSRLQLHLKQGSVDTPEEGYSLQHQLTFKSLWQISEAWQLDGALRYADRVKASTFANKDSAVSYATLDMRMAWQVYDMVELLVIGQNLLGEHRAFRVSTVDSQATDLELGVFFQADVYYQLF